MKYMKEDAPETEYQRYRTEFPRKLVLGAVSFALGYLGYQTIPAVMADCLPSKTMELALDSVTSDSDVSEDALKKEKDRWPTDPEILGYYFLYGENYMLHFKKAGEK